MTTPRQSTGRILAGLAPFLLLGLTLPLLAPSCGDFQPGVKTFAKGSLIIPMDVCYQCTRQSADGLDTATANCSKTGYVTAGGKACPQALSQGDVVKAYGLVYQLIRNDVAVYWVIDPQKQALDDYDLSLQFNGGFPVQKYDWAAGGPGAVPTQEKTVHYMGGPFVVDGSDQAKALAVLRAFQGTFSTVNVHVSNVAFQGTVAKTMAGGWSAGGAVPPKLALLDIGSGNLSTRTTAPNSTCDTSASATCVKEGAVWTCLGSAKNAEPVIQEYLAKAGIGTGAAGGTATGTHGQIYDRLGIADFQPAAGSTDWRTSNFAKEGYQILWVPHWVGPGSCSDFSSSCRCLATRYPVAQVDQVLKTVGAFSAAGGDVFAECAGLGTFEGAFSGLTSTLYTTDYQDGDPTTRFQTKTGVRYNQLATNPFPAPSYKPDNVANFASPLLQLGDFPFTPYTGAIEDYKPDDTANADRNYQPGVTRLIGTRVSSGTPAVARDWDFFTQRASSKTPGAAHGTIVYLAGHSYSGVQGNFQAAGTRLVLNTLFNLGAGCTTSGVACDTGLLGVCAKGTLACNGLGEQVCTPSVLPGTQPETCNGLDDDCDGLVDEGLEQGCYDGPGGTQGVGLCRAGVRSCVQNPDGSYGFSACQGQVLPADEVCNGLDDNCDNRVDEGLVQACYFGPTDTVNPVSGQPFGACKAGTQSCQAGNWGACRVCAPGETAADCQILPVADPCSAPESGTSGLDLNCDGQLDTCGACTNGQSRSCYSGPAGSAGVGPCRSGTQTCAGSAWGPCAGEVLPAAEICRDGIDQNCNGNADDGPPACNLCRYSATPASNEFLDCWTGPATAVFHTANAASVCVRGKRFCDATGEFGTTCDGQTLPGQELCNGKDDDCNGQIDDGATCGSGFACENGVCVFATCAPEIPCREGYDCVAGRCKVTGCGAGSSCAAGTVCNFGHCDDPCTGITCGAGSSCAGGFCTGGACYAAGCPDGKTCADGSTCNPGCPGGLPCPAAQVCQGGACVADPCAGLVCPSGTFCRQGDCVQSCAFASCGPNESCDVDGFCVADPCLGKSCAPNQTCQAGACVADPCIGVACGQGQRCEAGACADDPCNAVTCPVGLCRDGQCFSVTKANPGAGGTKEKGGGCGCGAGSASPLTLLGLLLALPLARRRRRGAASAGADDGSATFRGGALLLVLVAAGALTAGCTSKTATVFDPTTCAKLDPPLATCETENRCIDHNVDPSHCGACGKACGEAEKCVDGVCGPSSAVAPHVSSVNPASAPKGGLTPVTLTLGGERFKAGATVRASGPAGTVTLPATLAGSTLTATLDLTTAAPGTWTVRVVNPDLVISNGRAFGVVVPTPVIAAVVPLPDAGGSPPGVTTGGPRVLRLSGTGFMVDSACRVGGGTLPEQEIPATLTADGLECELDTTRIQPVTADVWVVNDADHVSAHRPFRVASATPAVTTLSPSLALQGSVAALDVFGTGFDLTSQVFFVGAGFPSGQALATTYIDGGRLFVSQLDLRICPGIGVCPVGSYQILVKNGSLTSNAVAFSVVASGQLPAVSGISPGSAFQGERPVVTVTGSNFPGGTVVEARPPGGAFAALPTSGTPTATTISATIDLVGVPAGSAPAGTWDVRLAYPAGQSSTFPFRVLSNGALITASPAPPGEAQGQVVPVTLTVSNLRPTTPPVGGITVAFSGGQTLVPTQPQAGQLRVNLDLRGVNTGVYTLVVQNPNGASPSNAVNFTVSPGAPTVSAVACTSVGTLCATATSAKQQLQKVPVRITGTNFAKPDAAGNNGSVVHVFAGCTPSVDAANRATCTCATGASAPPVCVPDFVLPVVDTTVTSATQLDLALDTTAAVPGTYSFWVWNPGGSPAPQRSPAPYQSFTIQP